MEVEVQEMKTCRGFCKKNLPTTMFYAKINFCKDCHKFRTAQNQAKRRNKSVSLKSKYLKFIGTESNLPSKSSSPLSQASTRDMTYEDLHQKIDDLNAKMNSYEKELQNLRDELKSLTLKESGVHSKYKALKLYAREKLSAKHLEKID